MPSQEELDKETGRSKATGRDTLRSDVMVGSGGKRELRVFSGGSQINQHSTEWGGKAEGAIFDVSTNSYTPDLDNQQGLDDDTNKRGKDDYEQPPAQEAGLPLFPGDAPIKSGGILVYDRDDDVKAGRWSMYPPDHNPETVDALMVWDDANEEVNWSDEASLEDAEDADVSILAFEDGKLSKLDGYSATEGILCQNGSPVDVKILINFD